MKYVIFAALSLVWASTATANECKSLWLERNGIFDARGYCFGSALGKGVFNNADCTTKNPNLSSSEQSRVAQIKRRENALGCTSQRKNWSVASMRNRGGTTQSVSSGGGNTCRALWVARNIIYDNRGYCFSSALGKGVFDNSNCFTKSPKLTGSEQSQVAKIQRQEKRQNCAAQKSSWTVSSFGGRVTSASRPRQPAQNLAPWQKALQWYAQTAQNLNASGGTRTYRCEIQCSNFKSDGRAYFSVYANSVGDAYNRSSNGSYEACRPYGGIAFLAGPYCE